MIVDVHAHCYPAPYVRELRRTGIDEEQEISLKIPEWSSADQRIEEMHALGIDMQVLSLSAPNVYFQDAEFSKALAQMTNDFLSDICKKYPDSFLSLASIPLNNLKYAIDELDRAITDLHMDGVVLGTHINKRPLADDHFLPFFEELDKRKVPVALHPLRSIVEDLMPIEDIKLAIHICVGYLFETTRTMAQMTLKGTFEKYRNLAFILPHSGGAIPFTYPRWDMTYLSRPNSHPLKKLPNVPSYYLKRHYYDTALSYHPSSLRCTLELATVDHVLFGTDYPYTSDFRAKETIEKIEGYGLSEEGKKKIYSENAAGLFPKLKGKASRINE
jgi:6-methylsalicylate decarboxylase